MDNLKRMYYYLKNIFYRKEYDSNEDLNEAVSNTGLDKLEKIYSVILENNLNNNVINKKNLINESEYDNIIINHLLKTEDDEINEIVDSSIKNQYIQNDSYKKYYSKIKNLNHIQKYTLDKLKDNNFDSGLVCICTGGGKEIKGYHNSYNTESNNIVIARVGDAGLVSYIQTKFFCTDNSIKLIQITECNKKYIYYYLKIIENDLKNNSGKNAQPNINQKMINSIDIKISSIENQNKIVEYLDKQIEFYQTFFNKVKLFYPNTEENDDKTNIDDKSDEI